MKSKSGHEPLLSLTPPPSCQSRPLYKGRLVPFSVMFFDGVPDFKVTDPDAVMRCVSERLCGVCGAGMGAIVTFVGGPISIANRLFIDPAMHRDCAAYAVSVCPFLNGDIRTMATDLKNAASVTIDPKVSIDRPERIGFLDSKRYRLARVQGDIYIHPDPGTIRWGGVTRDT